MQRSSAWIIGATAAISIGLVLLLTSSVLSSGQSEVIEIKEGYYLSYESPTLLNGNISGNFSVSPQGDKIEIRIFNETEFKVYDKLGDANLTDLYNATANNGTFSYTVNHTEKLFIVFDNHNNRTVTLTVHFRVIGLSVTVLEVSVGLFILGAILFFVSRRARTREWNPTRRGSSKR